MLKVFDFEALTGSEPTYTFTVEAMDTEGTMPPGLASVTVRIMVSVWVCVYTDIQGPHQCFCIYLLHLRKSYGTFISHQDALTSKTRVIVIALSNIAANFSPFHTIFVYLLFFLCV